ncbi:MAG: hypothetical protein ACFFD2_23865 [Promethearchaeota archaeon]
MTDIYIPIDYTNLKSVIPPGEDIIYSTLCKVTQTLLAGEIKWESHVLMTTKGFAYTKPQERKLLKGIYVDWNRIKLGRKTMGLRLTFFKLKRDPNYESRETFDKRSQNFKATIKPIVDARKKEWEAKVPNKRDRKKIAKNRRFKKEL